MQSHISHVELGSPLVLGAMEDLLDITLTPLIALDALGMRIPPGVILSAPCPIIDGGRMDKEDIRLCRLSCPFGDG